ncbi:MAG: hypothetical protein HY880_07745, partial [Deltaproteobacteria bacterium]|nr:hypothetical protein [Deltaproteobacteria bacterium]
DGAIETYKRIVAGGATPEMVVDAYVGMGDVYYAAGRWAYALSAYEKVLLELEPRDKAFILYKIGVISSEMGNKPAALNSWREAAVSDKGSHIARLAEERIKESMLWQSVGM